MCRDRIDRRAFLGMGIGAGAAAGLCALPAAVRAGEPGDPAEWNPDRTYAPVARPLAVQPVLLYAVATRREMSSWKSWGGVQSEEAAAAEAERIGRDLAALAGSVRFPLKVLPVIRVRTAEEAARARAVPHDVLAVFPASGGGDLLRSLLQPPMEAVKPPSSSGSPAASRQPPAVIFVRHRTAPLYYWYEALSTRYLRPDPEKAGAELSVDDVVVDDLDELAWRLRAHFAAANLMGSRIVAIGGPGGKYAGDAPETARKRFRMEILDVSYDDLGKRIRAAREDAKIAAASASGAERYRALPGTSVETERPFVEGSFLLARVFKDILREAGASIITVNSCMGTILPLARTTACLTLELLNDEGLLAFCESDFVIIPAGIFLHHLTRTPVFLHNSTFPHGGVVTCAHCTAPRRMDGVRWEPARILTHYESEFGAAPKVEVPVGQTVTCLDPEYTTGRWLGIRGTVEANPFYEICRSQQEVRIHGDWRKLLAEVRDSHWVMAYGDHLREAGYVSRKLGLVWDSVAPPS